LEARVATLSGVLSENSPSSLRATKKLLAAQNKLWLDAAVELGMEANAGARETKDFYEGVTAFLEKRKAVWASGAGGQG
jgi:methylglutaconyl-CoA hydratase